jgi:thiol-disulfide isomerase/thioredoxin
MHKKYWNFFSFLLVLLMFAPTAWPQKYSISLTVPDAADSVIYLAHHFNGQIFVDDTVRLDPQGKGIFEGDSPLDQGMYLVYLNKDHFADFLLGSDQQFEIIHRFSKPEEFSVKGAQDTELFNSYRLFLSGLKVRQQELVARRKAAGDDENRLKQVHAELDELDRKVTGFWFSEAKKYPGLFYSKFLLSNYIPVLNEKDIPENWLKNDSLRWVYEYNFRKDHYWDYLDVSDERFLRTPVLKPRIESFFDKVLIQQPDSVIPYAIETIEKAKASPKSFRYITTFLLNHFAQSQVMGMDAAFVKIAEKYYLSGQANWADSATIASIGRQVVFKRNNLLGMKAKELKMESWEGPYFSLHEIKTEYTVLVFWEPDCGHCKKQIPELYNDVYLPLQDKSISYFAVNSQGKKEEWENFINEHKLYNWIHVWDPQDLNNFRINFDVQTTPIIYILDKDKKIIAKKIDPQTVKKILEHLVLGKPL